MDTCEAVYHTDDSTCIVWIWTLAFASERLFLLKRRTWDRQIESDSRLWEE